MRDKFPKVMHPQFKPGLVSISFREISNEKIVELVSDAGLSGIEWGGDRHVPHGDIGIARRTRQSTLDAGLEVAAYGSYYRFDECFEDVTESGPEFDQVLDTASALGAPSIRVWAGRKDADALSDLESGRVVERAREIGEAAAKQSIRIDFEFHENTLTHTNESTACLLDRVNHPNVWTLWQPALQVGHAYRKSGLQSLVNRVSNIHCNYFGENAWPDQLELSDGASEWADYLEVVRQSCRNRWILIEHVKDHSEENFRKDAATLKDWLG